MRAYVPLTIPLLGELARTRHLDGRDTVVAQDEGEEAEYAALTAAADRSQQLLEGTGRRVVVVFEGPSPEGWPLDLLVAIHADTEDISAEEADPPELAWFAAQELDLLL